MAKPPAGSSLFNRGPLFQEPPSPPRGEGSTPPAPDGGSTTPVNAQPPAGASLLFSAISSDAFIKERKSGSFQMEMKDVESINWFTERPERAEGSWKPKKLVKQWDKYFADSQPNAQTTFRVTGIAGEQGFATFEMFKPKITSNNNLRFKVKPISKNGRDSLTDLVGKELDIASLFIDSATPGVPSCFPYCVGKDLRGLDMSGQDLYSNFERADFSPKGAIKTNLSGANLTGADLGRAKLYGADLGGAKMYGAELGGAHLEGADLTGADLTGATSDSTTTWPTAEYWNDTICPNETNSNGPRNKTCGF